MSTAKDTEITRMDLPDFVSAPWARMFGKELEQATWRGAGALKSLMSVDVVLKILQKASYCLKSEPTLLEISPSAETQVIVVGDTHGQLHDVLKMFDTAGDPSDVRKFVLNGDFVDRGAWGLEVLLVFLVWKLAFPNSVFLLRGNHETTTCTTMYGFKGEIEQKYGKPEGLAIYKSCKRLFATLPLAACINRATLVVHGGLFRKPTPAVPSRNKRKKKYAEATQCELGCLGDLRASGKGGLDPNGRGSTVVATDVLWSDPVGEEGLCLNTSRGVGVIFGPDVTQRFLEENGLRLVIRSHEGPDARFEREDMGGMQEGWTLDHKVAAGSLLTVFSAPDYPQFQPEEETRYCNLAAVAVLKAPDWCTPEMLQYAAVLPRPPAVAFYDYLFVPGSDEEIDIAGSEASQASLASLAPDVDDTAAQLLPPPTEPLPAVDPGPPWPNSNQQSAGDRAASASYIDSHASNGEHARSNGTATGLLNGSASVSMTNGAASLPINGSQDQRRTSLRQQQQRAHRDHSNNGLPIQKPLQVSTHRQVSQLVEPRISQGEAASQISFSSEAVSSANPAETQAVPLVELEASAPPAQNPEGVNPILPQDSVAQSSQPAPVLAGPCHELFQTPAPPLLLQVASHPGRELEQAAAHTLAVEGGVPQDTPETNPSQDRHLLGKVLSPLPEALPDTKLESLPEPAHQVLAATEPQSIDETPLKSRVEVDPANPAEALPDSLANGDLQSAADALPDASVLSSGEDGQPLHEGLENAPNALYEDTLVPEKQKAKPRKATADLEKQVPTRVSKRAKPPAPWR